MKNTFKKHSTTFVVTLLAAGSIFAVIAYNGSQMPPRDEPAASTQKTVTETQETTEQVEEVLTKVTVQETQLGTYKAKIVGFGEATSRYELDYTSEISGRVEWLSDLFQVGTQVSKGDLLARIDDSTYQQLVSEAESNLATAELELFEEQREGEQARSEWNRSGLKGEPDSPLVFREPQLASAQASVENARKSLVSAKNDLAYAEIRAPFDGVITERTLQLGAHISEGGSIGMLYSTDLIEIEVPLSNQQWTNLPPEAISESWTATISDGSSGKQWPAVIKREHLYVDKTTRQRSVVLIVDKPLATENKLFPGTFVKANIDGKERENIWQLPASALSQQGEVWVVDAQGLLNKYAATALFERDDYIYINPVVDGETVQVIVRPLSNFQVGMKVSPQVLLSEETGSEEMTKEAL
ncbi:efflux RND transporter periplasmic adaptor subunit [Marinomonas sp. 5E14-1]|uniref:efflux RND transporter periplasmic adaptor subunit n=1 Tax=Marinomonas sp. 5E14-1 TaxID=3153922 RepID=UPI00326370B0